MNDNDMGSFYEKLILRLGITNSELKRNKERQFEETVKKTPHEKIRETFTWGTRGINMDQPVKRILLKDIDDKHLENIITFVEDSGNLAYDSNRQELLKKFYDEKNYRKENNIEVIGNLLNNFKIGK